MTYERVKYKLIDNDRGTSLWIYDDPINWEKSDKTLKRSTKTYGVYTELSKDLGFTSKAMDFLLVAKANRSVEADVTLEEWRMYDDEDGFYLHSTGTFDFSEFTEDELQVQLPFKTGGLNAIVESKLSQDFEMDRLESIDGDVIDALTLVSVALTSREILLLSQLKALNEYVDGSWTQTFMPNMTIVSESDPRISELLDDEIIYNLDGKAVNMFYNNNDVSKTINIRFSWDLYARTFGFNTHLIKITVYKYNLSGTSYTLIDNTVVYDSGYLSQFAFTGENTVSFDLEMGDSLMYTIQSTGGSGLGQGTQRLFLNTFTIDVSEESVRDDSSTNAVLIHEMGEKLMQIITGRKGVFKSEFYGREEIGYQNDGEYSRTAMTLGFWVRDFLDKKMEFSIDKLIKTTNAIHNVGYTIETIENEDYFIMEDMKYFFQNVTTIILPEQVSKVKRKTATDFYSDSLLFGYNEPSGDNLYEEAMGLDEYNTQNGYTTPVKRVNNEYSKLSPARADSYGMEFARRKQKINYPEEDTRYDQHVFLMDLKLGDGTNLEQRTWVDDLEEIPTGVFSPETATNLRLTPFRCSERHQWFYGGGFYGVFKDEYIRFANSKGNSKLSTKKSGEVSRSERGDVQVSELAFPRFTGEWIEFEYEVDYYVNQQVYGKTEINGRQIPNYFGRVQFINENGLKEYGYLFELKPNGAGKWKLLKAL